MTRLRTPYTEPVHNPYPIEFDPNGDPIHPEAHSPAAIIIARQRLREQERRLLRTTVNFVAWAVLLWAILGLGIWGAYVAAQRVDAATQEDFIAKPRSINP